MPQAVLSLRKRKYRPPKAGGGLPTTKVLSSAIFMTRRRLSKHDHVAQRRARARGGDRLIDLVQWIPPGDEFVELEASFPVERDNPRHIDHGAGRAHLGAENPLSGRGERTR